MRSSAVLGGWNADCQMGSRTRGLESHVLLMLAIILLILWALGFVAFHVGGGLIHILLVVALIVIVVRLIQGRRAL